MLTYVMDVCHTIGRPDKLLPIPYQIQLPAQTLQRVRLAVMCVSL